VSTQTALLTPPVAAVEPRTVSRPETPTREPKRGKRAYWGDRFTILFWIACFGLMAAMNLSEVIYRFFFWLFGSSPTP
jgi:hypothetical protein